MGSYFVDHGRVKDKVNQGKRLNTEYKEPQENLFNVLPAKLMILLSHHVIMDKNI